MNKAQQAYNKLSSIQSYLIWMSTGETIPECDANWDAKDIIKDLKHEMLREDTDNMRLQISMTEAWEYADKWEEVYHFARAERKRAIQWLEDGQYTSIY